MEPEFAKLKNKTKILQKEKDQCQSRIASLETDIRNLMKKKNFTDDEIVDYFSNQKQIKSLQEKLYRAESESMELRKSLAQQSSTYMSSINGDISACQSFIESNNKFTMDITKKVSEKQKLLSDALYENASLKKAISITEAENAKLTAELQEVKWKLSNSIPADSNENSTSSKFKSQDDMTIEALENKLVEKEQQLQEATNTISKLKSSISNDLSVRQKEFSREIEEHKEELKKARQEIKRLTTKNKESDSKIASYEQKLQETQQELIAKMQTLSQIQNDENQDLFSFSNSESKDGNDRLLSELRNMKALCVSLRDQNKSLKEENLHLKMKTNELKLAYEKEREKNIKPAALRDEVIRLRAELNAVKPNSKYHKHHIPSNNFSHSISHSIDSSYDYNSQIGSVPLTPLMRKMIQRYQYDLTLKFNFFQTKIQTELDKLEIVFERFETAWNHLNLISQTPNALAPLPKKNTPEEFVEFLRREVRNIKGMSLAYAESHKIPTERIPKPCELISNPKILKKFVVNKEI